MPAEQSAGPKLQPRRDSRLKLVIRYFLLLAFAVYGAGAVLDALANHTFRLREPVSLAVLAGTLVLSAIVFHLVRKGDMPFRSWCAVPLIVAVGSGLFANYNLSGLLSDVGAMEIGVGAGLISFSALQLWADFQKPREWFALLALTALIGFGAVSGLVVWFSS